MKSEIKFIIAFFIGGLEWMFFGMSFFLDWNFLIELGILIVLANIGFFTFLSAWKNKKWIIKKK